MSLYNYIITICVFFAVVQLTASYYACEFSNRTITYGNYHNYYNTTSESSTACQLPMKVDNNDIVMVTAASDVYFNGGRNCGNCLRIRNLAQGGKSRTAMIVDQKGSAGLDIAVSLFNYLDNSARAGYAAGNMQVEVVTVPCAGLVNKLKYRFKSGSVSNGWFVLSIVDHLMPISNVYVSQTINGSWHECAYSNSIKNYYDCAGHPSYTLPMAVKVKSSDGQEITDSISQITSENNPVNSTKQFQFPNSCMPCCGAPTFKPKPSTSAPVPPSTTTQTISSAVNEVRRTSNALFAVCQFFVLSVLI